MKGTRVEWDPSELKRRVKDGMKRNLRAAANVVKAAEKQTLSKQGGMLRKKKGKKAATKKNPKTGKLVRLREPSAPGQAPHKLTGRLSRAVFAAYGKGVAWVWVRGGNLTEYGTVNMAARPHLRPTFNREKGRVVNELSKPV